MSVQVEFSDELLAASHAEIAGIERQRRENVMGKRVKSLDEVAQRLGFD